MKLGKRARKWEGGSHEFVSCRERTEGAGSLEGAEEAGTRGLVGMGRSEGAEKAGSRCSREGSDVVTVVGCSMSKFEFCVGCLKGS